MPQVPIIIPVIVLGILFGSLIKAGKKSIPKRRLLIASLVSGALNSAQAYLLTLITPRTTFSNGSTASRAAQSTLGLGFFLESFLTGFLLVLVVMAIAAVYLRVRGRGEIETAEESETEEELKLTSG